MSKKNQKNLSQITTSENGNHVLLSMKQSLMIVTCTICVNWEATNHIETINLFISSYRTHTRTANTHLKKCLPASWNLYAQFFNLSNIYLLKFMTAIGGSIVAREIGSRWNKKSAKPRQKFMIYHIFFVPFIRKRIFRWKRWWC